MCWSGKSDSQRVETLLQRISNGALPEERQDAVAELRDVLQSNPEVRKGSDANPSPPQQPHSLSH